MDARDEELVAQWRADAKAAGVYAVAKRKKGQAVITCPHCGNLHHHGWGTGYRSPHCSDMKMRDKGDYFVECDPA